MISTEQKRRIVGEIASRSKNYASNAAFAQALEINPAQLSRLLKGEHDKVLSDDNFLRIAQEMGIDLKENEWKTAKTPTFAKITSQLATCQSESISAMMIDEAGVGKTHAAKEYVKTHANSIYIDCSQVKSRQLLIREIARKFGVNPRGRYADVYKNLVFYINTSSQAPLIILDEAGDLQYAAFLELKALWNATENMCGFYMMGADGLKAKIERNIDNEKVGYTEMFRRFGSRFQKSCPDGKEASEEFMKEQISLVAKANGMDNVQKLYVLTGGSLTRLKIEYLKAKRNGQAR